MMVLTKQQHLLSKQIISLQIMWTVVTIAVFLFSVILRNRFFLDDAIPVMVLGFFMLINAIIIIRNAAEIDKKGRLYINLNFNLL